MDSEQISVESRLRGSLIGLACGDAVGTAVEFCRPGSFEPLTDMIGGGAFKLQPGQWTDDTSMALCLAESLVEKGKLDLCDQLKRYLDWFENGHLASNGSCFDIGMTTNNALNRFRKDPQNPIVGPQQEKAAGNGSLMRLCPAPLAFWRQPLAAIEAAAWSSKTTHGAPQCMASCRYFAGLLVGCMNGVSKEELLSPFYSPLGRDYWEKNDESLHREVKEVIGGSFRVLEPPEITGSGYVVKTIEAALWAFYRTDNYRDGCLKVANLGRDADTTAAIYGQIAGAYYGEKGIPQEWRDKCALLPVICLLADELALMAEHYATVNLDAMIQTGYLSDGDLSQLPPPYTASEVYCNLKLMGYDKMEEDMRLFVRRMLPSPKAYRTRYDAFQAKDELIANYHKLDEKFQSEAILASVVKILDGLIADNRRLKD